jgi:Flp pilus assembly protein TadG
MKRAPQAILDELGSAVVESALSFGLLMMTVLGIFYCSWALYAYEFVSYAAQQGARYAIVRGYNWSPAVCTSPSTQACVATAANVTSYVQSLVTPGISANNLVVTSAWPGYTIQNASCSNVNAAGCLVTVQVTYNFKFSLPLIPISAMTFHSSSEQVIQD